MNLAKKAGATWALRKTTIVDMDKLETYLENSCKEESEEEDGVSKKES